MISLIELPHKIIKFKVARRSEILRGGIKVASIRIDGAVSFIWQHRKNRLYN